MGKFSILLCDSDPTYAKRLAAGLKRQLKERASINTSTRMDEFADGDQVAHMLVSSQTPDAQWQKRHEDCVYIWLDDGESDDENLLWQLRIFKYQSVSQIGKELMKYLPSRRSDKEFKGVMSEQKWYGVVSPARHESTIPYGMALAQLLGETKHTLLVLLMEFSGVVPLLDLERNSGMEEFLLELRKKDLGDVNLVPMPNMYQLTGVDVMNVTDNPMVLYELVESDLQRLVQRIQCCEKYGAVVWVAGNMVQGIGNLFQNSEKVFLVEKGDSYSQCCQKEFQKFADKLGVDQELLIPLSLPVLKGIQPGEHLLLQWRQSPIGDAARKQLEGAIGNGTFDRNHAQSDIESTGYQL